MHVLKHRAIGQAVAVIMGIGAAVGLAAPNASATPGHSSALVFPHDPAHPHAHWFVQRTVSAPAVGAPSPRLGNAPAVASPRGGNVAVSTGYESQVCHTDNIDEVTGGGPITLTLTNSRAIASSYTASATVTASIISSAVGFSVTNTYTQTESGAYTVPALKWGGIIAHPLYDVYGFEVIDPNFNAVVGYGEALRPAGFCYETWAN